MQLLADTLIEERAMQRTWNSVMIMLFFSGERFASYLLQSLLKAPTGGAAS